MGAMRLAVIRFVLVGTSAATDASIDHACRSLNGGANQVNRSILANSKIALTRSS